MGEFQIHNSDDSINRDKDGSVRRCPINVRYFGHIFGTFDTTDPLNLINRQQVGRVVVMIKMVMFVCVCEVLWHVYKPVTVFISLSVCLSVCLEQFLSGGTFLQDSSTNMLLDAVDIHHNNQHQQSQDKH